LSWLWLWLLAPLGLLLVGVFLPILTDVGHSSIHERGIKANGARDAGMLAARVEPSELLVWPQVSWSRTTIEIEMRGDGSLKYGVRRTTDPVELDAFRPWSKYFTAAVGFERCPSVSERVTLLRSKSIREPCRGSFGAEKFEVVEYRTSASLLVGHCTTAGCFLRGRVDSSSNEVLLRLNPRSLLFFLPE
jgi:hypothetical protein